MNKILYLILFLTISLFSFSQDEYYRKIDWKFYPRNLIQLTDSTYVFDAEPFDYNDPGSTSRTIGNYVVDFVGHRFKVIDSTLTTITVLDIYSTGSGPQTDQIARCYLSVGNGEANFIGSIDYSPLDESTRWKLNGSDNELLWRHAEGLIQNEEYSSTWDGKDRVAASKNAIYDKINSMEAAVYSYTVTEDSQNNFNIPFVVKPTALVFLNNTLLPKDSWEGDDTTILIIEPPLKRYDYIVVNKN